MSRREDLEWMRDIVRTSIESVEPGKRAPLVSQLRHIVAELDAAGGESSTGERSGLIDFQEALSKRRQSKTKGPRRAEPS